MTTHLTPDEFVDAIDATLPASRTSHLDACEACQSEVASLRAVLADAASVPAAEPSPLFWDHFSARVAEATREQAAPRWWQPTWRLTLGAAALTAVVALAFGIGSRIADDENGVAPAPVVADAGDAGDAGDGPLFEDDGSWDFVVGMSAGLAFEDVREAVVPAAGSADEIIAGLTAEQRAEFMRLLRQEIGEP